MKHLKNGFIILILICLVATAAFYLFRDRTQAALDKKISVSLALNREADELFAGDSFAEARELLLESLSLNRLNPRTYVYLAFAELNLGNEKEAYEHFVSALNMEVTSEEIIKNFAELLIKNGYYAEVQKYLRYGLQDYPESEDLIFLQGKAYLLSGSFNHAIKNFERLLEGQGDSSIIYKYLGLAYYFSGEKEKAAAFYSEYLLQEGLPVDAETADADFLHEQVLAQGGGQNG